MSDNPYDPPKWQPAPRAEDEGPIRLGEAVGLALAAVGTSQEDIGEVREWLMAYLSDWGDEIRKQANEATMGKIAAAQREAAEATRWRCNTTERCLLEDGHEGPHGFPVIPYREVAQ